MMERSTGAGAVSAAVHRRSHRAFPQDPPGDRPGQGALTASPQWLMENDSYAHRQLWRIVREIDGCACASRHPRQRLKRHLLHVVLQAGLGLRSLRPGRRRNQVRWAWADDALLEV